jgi:hypothetical protein
VNELFPVLAGILVGVCAQLLAASPRGKAAVVLSLCVTFGVLASWVSGELLRSPLFMVVDSVLVLVSAGAALIALEGWRRLPGRTQ